MANQRAVGSGTSGGVALSFRPSRLVSPDTVPRASESFLGTKQAYDFSVSSAHDTASKMNSRLVVASQFGIHRHGSVAEPFDTVPLKPKLQACVLLRLILSRVSHFHSLPRLSHMCFLCLWTHSILREQLEHSFRSVKSIPAAGSS